MSLDADIAANAMIIDGGNIQVPQPQGGQK